MTTPAQEAKKRNHKWGEDNTCIHCGLEREMRTWKRLMAMVGSKDYYQYGRQYAYSYDGWDTWSFKRPPCKPLSGD